MSRVRRGLHLLGAALFAVGLSVSCGGASKAGAARVKQNEAGEKAAHAVPELVQAEQFLEASAYPEAESILRRLVRVGAQKSEANLSLSEVLLATGRYAEAVRHALVAAESAALAEKGLAVAIQGQLRQGLVAEAEALARRAAAPVAAWRGKRLLGEVLFLQGKRSEGEPVLMAVIEAYNDDAISDADARGLVQVGRAASLLQSPHDANDAYNLAEQAAPKPGIELLQWRASMLLQRHDPGQAEQVLLQLLSRAPRHAQALATLAQAKLAQTMDFDAAEALARKALETDPNLSEAYFVLGGIRLRDLELGEAEAEIQRGLLHNPRDLELLSLQATVRFLAGDRKTFDALEKEVLGYNPKFTRFYSIVAEYADWEHRYEEVVVLMQRALLADGEDPSAHAGLGLNLIRVGDDAAGRAALKRAFDRDPFNVRVYNTLNLFDEVVDKEYQTHNSGPFRLRFHQDEAAVLQRYVPTLLAEGWKTMVGHYAVVPSSPLGVELYREREHFAVRTSGLPNIGIQGVCFGKTLALVTPHSQPVNLGMTLWHELAHVFHIQLSNSRVPRWFTEGLAEYETLVRRSEWSREHDLELYRALEEGKLPKILQMNQAFTHAESLEGMAVAYYASTQIVTLLAQRFGREKLRQMLVLWGEGKSTEQVLQLALGVSAQELDTLIHQALTLRLARYQGQFVAVHGAGNPERLQADLKENPGDPGLRLKAAVSLLEAGQFELGRAALSALLSEYPNDVQGRYAMARLNLASKEPSPCRARLMALLQEGHDGYEIQLLLAKCQLVADEDPKLALQRAHTLDPTQAEPLSMLWQWAQGRRDSDLEVVTLRTLVTLEQHTPAYFQRLLELLLARGAIAEALSVGASAIWVDVTNVRLHARYAEALNAAGRLDSAEFEFEAALACPGEPQERAQVHLRYAELLHQRGQKARAARHRALAAQIGTAPGSEAGAEN